MTDAHQHALVDIAILDDDPDFRTYLEDALKDDGQYSVRAFAHAGGVVCRLEQRLPDIVLLDMKMGEFKGDKVLEQLLAAHPTLCVIIVTGYPSLEDMRATFKLKVFDYLSKPFSLAQLRQTLNNAIEKFGLGRTTQDRLRERLGHRIKMLRVERDWSLKDLAATTNSASRRSAPSSAAPICRASRACWPSAGHSTRGRRKCWPRSISRFGGAACTLFRARYLLHDFHPVFLAVGVEDVHLLAIDGELHGVSGLEVSRFCVVETAAFAHEICTRRAFEQVRIPDLHDGHVALAAVRSVVC